MGDTVTNMNYAVKEDGTIVRNRKCTKCGKESSSGGDYCEYCGHRLPKVNLKKGLDYEKEPTEWMIMLMVFGTFFFGIGGIWVGFYFNGVVECDGVLQYRFDLKTRHWGIGTIVVAVLSTIIWSACLF